MNRCFVRALPALAALLTATTWEPSTSHAQAKPRHGAEHYRGSARPVTPGEVALWVPRVVFFPVHVVSEFGLRRPFRALAGFVEQHHLHIYTMRALNPTPDFSWYPSFTYDVGFAPMVGAGFTWNNALARDNQLKFSGTTAGPGYVEVSVRDRVTLGPFRLGGRLSYFDRPDRIFFGLGPNTELDAITRYRRTYAEAMGLFDWRPSPHLRFELEGGYRSDETGPGSTAAVPGQPRRVSIDERFAVQDPSIVPGFGRLDLAIASTQLTLDTRGGYDDASGARLQIGGLYGHDVNNTERRFLVTEALVEGAVEVIQPRRVLVASVYVSDTQPLGREPVPFTYMPSLGRGLHPGFRFGRFIGESAFVAELDYHYPIWSHLDALWMVSAGNVFGRHLSGFDPSRFTGTAGVGLRTNFAQWAPVEMLFALGSNRFNEPFGIEGFRFYIGVNRGL